MLANKRNFFSIGYHSEETRKFDKKLISVKNIGMQAIIWKYTRNNEWYIL